MRLSCGIFSGEAEVLTIIQLRVGCSCLSVCKISNPTPGQRSNARNNRDDIHERAPFY